MRYSIVYYSQEVEEDILSLPSHLKARYISLTERMIEHGAHLGEPHTKPFGSGLFELKLRSAEGAVRIFYCTLMGKQIVMLHSFTKKTQKTPLKELRKAEVRMKEIKNDT